jgi:hypothetical protein
MIGAAKAAVVVHDRRDHDERRRRDPALQSSVPAEHLIEGVKVEVGRNQRFTCGRLGGNIHRRAPLDDRCRRKDFRQAAGRKVVDFEGAS